MRGNASRLRREMVARDAVAAAVDSVPDISGFERPGLERVVSAAQKFGYKCGAVPVENGMDVVFVYGTLQPGWGLHKKIGGYVVAYEPRAKLLDYRMYAHFYPWITPAEHGEERVWGTLLYLRDAPVAVSRLDVVELGAGYERVRVEVQTPNGPVSAWAYVWTNREYVPWREDDFVASGDFAEFDEEGEAWEDG